MITLTPEQTQSVQQSKEPVRVTDPQQREYVLMRSELYERMKRILEPAEVDPSFYECDDPIPES